VPSNGGVDLLVMVGTGFSGVLGGSGTSDILEETGIISFDAGENFMGTN